MRVIFLINSLRYGGANKVLIDIANYLSESNCEVFLILYNDEIPFYELNENIKVSYLSSYKIKINKLRRIFQVIKLRKKIKIFKPDALITFNNLGKLMGMFGVMFTRVKLIISERMDPYSYKPNSKRYMYMRYRAADGCVFQTREASEYFPKSVRDKSIIIPNYIDVHDSEINEANTDFIKPLYDIIFIGRFDIRQKRQDLMIKAFSKVLKNYPDLLLAFFGDGPDIDKIKKLSEHYGISNNILFNGVTKDIYAELRKSKIYVLTSDYEGIPNSLMEAMAAGLPVISTNCSPGGAKLLISDKVNGLLVNRDNVDELAKAITYLLENPEARKRLGSEAKKITKKFKKSEILPKWEEFITNTVKGAKK